MIKLIVVFNAAKNSHNIASYSVEISNADWETSAREFGQSGPVWNDKQTLVGIFETEQEAIDALISYLSPSVRAFDIVRDVDHVNEIDEPGRWTTTTVVPVNSQPRGAGIQRALLARVTRHGVWRAGQVAA